MLAKVLMDLRRKVWISIEDALVQINQHLGPLTLILTFEQIIQGTISGNKGVSGEKDFMGVVQPDIPTDRGVGIGHDR
jgi:hypothetical protein